MTQQGSFKRRGLQLYLDIMNRHRGVTVIYSIILFIACPLINFMEFNAASKRDYISPSYFISFDNIIVMVAAGIVMAVILAPMILRFMHQKQAIDMYYALPVKRETLFLSHISAGLTLIIVPQIVNFILFSGIAALYAQYYGGFLFTKCLQFFLYSLVMIIATFMLSAFAAVLVGTTFDSFTFGAILHFVVPVILLITTGVFSVGLFGYTISSGLEEVMRFSSPTIAIFRFGHDDKFPLGFLLGWLFIVLALVIGSTILFKLRKSEVAGRALPDGILHIGIKAVFTYAGGLGFMAIIYMLDYDSSPGVWLVIPFIFGAAISFALVQGILARSFKTLLKCWKQYLIITFCGCLIIITAFTGGLGYETRVPDAGQVKSVTINVYDYMPDELRGLTYAVDMPYELELTSPESIEAYRKLHESVITAYREDNDDNGYGRYMNIEYNLNSGNTLKRTYYAVPSDLDIEFLKSLGTEFYMAINPIYQLNADDLRWASISDTLDFSQTTIDLTAEISMGRRLLEALQNDMRRQNPEQIYRPDQGKVCNLSLTLRDYIQPADWLENTGEKESLSSATLSIMPWYEETLALLTEWGYDEYFTVNLEKVEYAYVIDKGQEFLYYWDGVSLEQVVYWMSDYTVSSNYLEYAETHPEYFQKVTDPAQIQDLCDRITASSWYLWPSGEGQAVCFVISGINAENTNFYSISD